MQVLVLQRLVLVVLKVLVRLEVREMVVLELLVVVVQRRWRRRRRLCR